MSLYPLKFTPLAKYRIWGGNKLNTVLQNQQRADEMGENGYQYVQQNYSWETVLNKFNLIIADLTHKQ